MPERTFEELLRDAVRAPATVPEEAVEMLLDRAYPTWRGMYAEYLDQERARARQVLTPIVPVILRSREDAVALSFAKVDQMGRGMFGKPGWGKLTAAYWQEARRSLGLGRQSMTDEEIVARLGGLAHV